MLSYNEVILKWHVQEKPGDKYITKLLTYFLGYHIFSNFQSRGREREDEYELT